MLSDIEDSHGPSDAMHNPSQPLKVGKTLFQNSWRFTHFYQLSHSELVDIEKVALSSSLRSLKSKCTIESRAKKRSSINLIRTLVKLNLQYYTDQQGTVVIATIFDEVTKTLSSISVDYY
ncbi:hypothetical protein Tco_0773219 [Tanacetum coccineum]|uniref:Uncharacterized protein n=1 Tax=Tanacetum coccineum TaxID=301880 RepID=A0ABQ4ZK39_9ASTR